MIPIPDGALLILGAFGCVLTGVGFARLYLWGN